MTFKSTIFLKLREIKNNYENKIQKIWKRIRTNRIAPWLSITRIININRNIMIIASSNRINRQIKKVRHVNPVNCLKRKKTPMSKSRYEGDASFTDQSWLSFV